MTEIGNQEKPDMHRSKTAGLPGHTTENSKDCPRCQEQRRRGSHRYY